MGVYLKKSPQQSFRMFMITHPAIQASIEGLLVAVIIAAVGCGLLQVVVVIKATQEVIRLFWMRNIRPQMTTF